MRVIDVCDDDESSESSFFYDEVLVEKTEAWEN
jgi:hypothetical protein